MAPTYKTVRWEFDFGAWQFWTGAAASEHGEHVMAELMEVDITTIRRWARGAYSEGFPYPSMTNLMKFCNLLDVSPAKFFTTSE